MSGLGVNRLAPGTSLDVQVVEGRPVRKEMGMDTSKAGCKLPHSSCDFSVSFY